MKLSLSCRYVSYAPWYSLQDHVTSSSHPSMVPVSISSSVSFLFLVSWQLVWNRKMLHILGTPSTILSNTECISCGLAASWMLNSWSNSHVQERTKYNVILLIMYDHAWSWPWYWLLHSPYKLESRLTLPPSQFNPQSCYVILDFKSVDEELMCDHLYESYWTVLFGDNKSCGWCFLVNECNPDKVQTNQMRASEQYFQR